MVKRLLLASPRGYCAGVDRAVDTVERALDLWGPPIYVRKQIVHNVHVVRDLEARGAVFVESENEVPRGATVVFSAHGVSPAVHTNARRRELKAIDATCPLVTKVH
jgi:4-hydroxy-3-methylbut-2-en-1-yl diphosphate reductase